MQTRRSGRIISRFLFTSIVIFPSLCLDLESHGLLCAGRCKKGSWEGQRPTRLSAPPKRLISADTLVTDDTRTPQPRRRSLSSPYAQPSPHNLRPPRRLKYLPLTRQPLPLPARPLQDPHNLLGDLLKVARREREDRGPRAREAAAQEAGLRGGRHGGDDLAEAGDQGAAVGLVELVLHREVDELRVRGRLAEGDGEEGYPLEVEGLWPR